MKYIWDAPINVKPAGGGEGGEGEVGIGRDFDFD